MCVLVATCPPVTQGFCREGARGEREREREERDIEREGERGKTRQKERDTRMDIHQKFGTKSASFVGEIFAITKLIFLQKAWVAQEHPAICLQKPWTSTDWK